MKQGDFALFAWDNYYPRGGMNDLCGYFADHLAAYDFWLYSDHCKEMYGFQIVDTETWDVVQEGRRRDDR